jgi:hypothetical protein
MHFPDHFFNDFPHTGLRGLSHKENFIRKLPLGGLMDKMRQKFIFSNPAALFFAQDDKGHGFSPLIWKHRFFEGTGKLVHAPKSSLYIITRKMNPFSQQPMGIHQARFTYF